MNRMLRNIAYCFLRIYYKINGDHLILESGSCIKNGSSFEGFNKICKNSYFSGKMGFGTYIGDNSSVTGSIGRFCSIASSVTFLTKTHPVEAYVSSHPAFYSLKKQCGLTFVSEQLYNEEPLLPDKDVSIEVGNDVYIGYGATIIGPVKIGNGAVIAANSTVTKDVAPYTIVGGTPAKYIKKRFSDDEIEYLNTLKWWDNDLRWFKKYGNHFYSVEALKKRLEESNNQ